MVFVPRPMDIYMLMHLFFSSNLWTWCLYHVRLNNSSYHFICLLVLWIWTRLWRRNQVEVMNQNFHSFFLVLVYVYMLVCRCMNIYTFMSFIAYIFGYGPNDERLSYSLLLFRYSDVALVPRPSDEHLPLLHVLFGLISICLCNPFKI